MMSRSTWMLALVLLVPGCGPPGGAGPQDPGDEIEPSLALSQFGDACKLLPPAPIALAWVDVDTLRGGPVEDLLLDPPGTGETIPTPDVSFLTENMGSIRRIAGGLWITVSGPRLLLLVEGDLEITDVFAAVESWAEQKGTEAEAVKVLGRPALRVGPAVMVEIRPGLYANGPEGLVTHTLELFEKRTTGDACTKDLAYLAKKTPGAAPLLVAAGFVPPSANEWLEARHLPSVVGARWMLAASVDDDVDLRLGLLPGKSIKPIWFAQELNTFFVRAADDEGIVEMGLSEWVEDLDVELLSKGVVVRGSLDVERIFDLVGSTGGGG